ncbi:MAG: bifunctional phosphoribosylaminoimidazolecarboxamide formyltransferase/IMP cyclohydrolase [Candidatus Peribacteraceae bacterium]
MSLPPKRRALLSVSDKSGLLELAEKLVQNGFELLSTGGTYRALQEAKIPVLRVEDVTHAPESFGGRVKTLHPMIAGGILFRRDHADDVKDAGAQGVIPIDIVVVNLYPFQKTVESMGLVPSVDTPLPEEAIEQIDIGGPTLLRAAAKNFSAVTVLCDPSDYSRVIAELHSKKTTSLELRRELAAKVFTHTAAYDALIAEHMTGGVTDGIVLTGAKALRYGENPHQWGKFADFYGRGEHTWKQLQGKELSYLNLLDGDGAWRMVSEFSLPAAVMVKHANPSGIAVKDTIEDAFQAAYDTDRLSAFGVIIALNRVCSAEIAQKILDQKIFVEVVLAPLFDPNAVALLSAKPNIRLLEMDDTKFSEHALYRSAFGGMLIQNDDLKEITEKDLTVVTKLKPTKEQIADLLFAWKVVKHAKSNAIVLAKDQVTIGIGCGQTSRVDSTWIALKRAGEKAKNSVLASDAFFPFPDSIEEAAKHGITAVIQPGGSIKDADVFARADELGIAMVTTGTRAFRH